jgi:hypothetical protein
MQAGAVAFGERAGRVIVASPPERAADFRARASAVGTYLGVAGGEGLDLRIGPAHISVAVGRLAEAWRPGF